MSNDVLDERKECKDIIIFNQREDSISFVKRIHQEFRDTFYSKYEKLKDLRDDFVVGLETDVLKDLYDATILKMMERISDLTDIILNVYVDLLCPSMERQQRKTCSGCDRKQYNYDTFAREHSCWTIPKKDILEKCVTEVGLQKNIIRVRNNTFFKF